MAMSPQQMEFLSQKLTTSLQDMETKVIELIAKTASSQVDLKNWRELKLAQIQQLKNNVEKLVQQYAKAAPGELQSIIQQAFDAGAQSADEDFAAARAAGAIKDVQASASSSSFGAINNLMVTEYVAQTSGLVQNALFQTVRQSTDIYRKVVSDNALMTLTGAETKLQTVQRSLRQFADQGITTFTDKAGRNWDIASYTDMAVRTAVGQAAMAGHTQRIQELGEDLVIVSDHPEECPICRKWEGQVLSISGNSTEYKSVKEAKSAGLWHPNCGHVATAYFPGFTKPIKPEHDEKNAKGYEDKQKQRYLERQTRKWKRRKAAAVTDEEKQLANKKIGEYDAKMKQHLQNTGAARRKDREQINFGVKATAPKVPGASQEQILDVKVIDGLELNKWAKDSPIKGVLTKEPVKLHYSTAANQLPPDAPAGIFVNFFGDEAKEKAAGGPVQIVYTNVTNPLTVDFAKKTQKSVYDKYQAKAQKLALADTSKTQGQHMSELMQKDGYDAVIIKNGPNGTRVAHVFNKDNIAILKEQPTPPIPVKNTMPTKAAEPAKPSQPTKDISQFADSLFDEPPKKSVSQPVSTPPEKLVTTNSDVTVYEHVGTNSADVVRDKKTLSLRGSRNSEVKALTTYSGSTYRQINRYMRSGKTNQPAGSEIAYLSRKIEEAINNLGKPLTKDTLVTRHIDIDGIPFLFNDKISDLIGDIKYFTRAGQVGSADYNDAVGKLTKTLHGTTFTDKTFLSTSRKPGGVFIDEVRFLIQLPKGYKNGVFIESISAHPSELEYLINAGETFEVVDFEHSSTERRFIFTVRPVVK